MIILADCIDPFEKKPSIPAVKVLLPLFGIAFIVTLPDPDSAPMPLVSSCNS